jgi:RHS repeat-associated protein
MLASFSYDAAGVPTSVQVGSDPATAPRYYYVYNGHGDVVALTDASGTSVAAYAYDAWGVVQMDTEHFANGWRNPYLYDGRDGARYDTETGLYWLAVRAYDPTLGRFLSHDPLGRAPLFFADQPYAYAGNHPLLNVDPSGERFVRDPDVGAPPAPTHRVAGLAAPRVRTVRPSRRAGSHKARTCGRDCWLGNAKDVAGTTAALLAGAALVMGFAVLALGQFAAYLAGLAAGFAEAALASIWCPVCAVGFAALAAVFATASLVVADVAYELKWLIAEAGVLGVAFQFEASNGSLTSRYVQNTFIPRLTAIVGAFGVARLLFEAWDLLRGQAGIERLIGGMLNTFLAGGTLLAWSLSRALEMERDLQKGGL